ncbi:MAG: diacylglycerol kinase [Microbacteriaceae bacterium]|nr:diacylglycerol kinase [Microbacteriaceae bacterium]
MTTREIRRIVVAINPQASFGRSRKVGPEVVASLKSAGYDVTPIIEVDFDHLMVTTANALKSADALIVVGGDGMVNLAANLVAGSDIPFGLVPSGTGNDMARGLGIPFHDTGAAIELLKTCLKLEPRKIDAGRATQLDGSTGWFACVFSAGFDAIVNERANQMRWPKGRQRYNLAMLRELAALNPISYDLEIDGEHVSQKAVLVAVANNLSFGGGMKVTPDASLDDGLFDVLLVEPLSRLAFLRIFPRVFKGTHVADPKVSIRRAKRVRVDAEGIVAYADGERVGRLPIEIEMVPGALKVLAP